MKFDPLQISIAALGAVLTGICAVGVSYLSDMSHSVTDLNAKMGVVLKSVTDHNEELRDHELRMRGIEHDLARILESSDRESRRK
jgi:hypothetical protein